MNSDSLDDNIHALEIQQELVELQVVSTDSSLISYNQIEGGGTANTFFEMCFENPSVKFIQKIDKYYQNGEQSAESEYNYMKILYENGFSIPQPFFLKLVPNTRNLLYYVMEKIEGLRLVEVKEKNPNQYEKLIENLIKELYKIHNLDPLLFPTIPTFDIKENPHAAIDEKLTIGKLYLERYPEDLAELRSVFEWLEKNKDHYPCNELVVNHGDFHSFNIIVQENHEFKILDWNAMSLNDYRMDVAYTATTESYFDKNQTMKDRMDRVFWISNVYEQISGKKIEGLVFFMILAATFNLIRLYSQINNPDITGENEKTKEFFKIVNDYFLFLAYVIKKECNIDLKQLREFFEEI